MLCPRNAAFLVLVVDIASCNSLAGSVAEEGKKSVEENRKQSCSSACHDGPTETTDQRVPCLHTLNDESTEGDPEAFAEPCA